MTCALCGKDVRSVYSRPGEFTVRMCATCLFKPVPITTSSTGERR